MDYLVKAVIFIPFMLMVYFVSDYFIEILKVELATFGFSAIMCQFGIYTGIESFFSIVITAFGFKQILSFLK